MKTRSTLGAAFVSSLTLLFSFMPSSAEAAPGLSASTADGARFVGQASNVWGTASGAPNSRVFTQVQRNGAWSTSQTTTTDGSGGYVLPLTYGMDDAGTTTWRVGVDGPSGRTYSETFTVERIGPVTASSAGTRPVDAVSNVWGSVGNTSEAHVFTQVKVGGSWVTSQRDATNSNGGYVLPLTYGQGTAGTTTWRVGTRTEAGTHFSSTFALTRTGDVSATAASKRQVNTNSYTWGSVDGAPGATVFTQVRVGGSWVTSRTGTANDNGGFILPLTYASGSTGTYTWRVGARTAAGTVYSDTFTQQHTGSSAVAAMNAALTRVGSAYVARAAGPNAFDCSGLTYWAYQQVGVTLPRSSGTQANVGRPVSRSELQPGDLVFFYSPISHVGIYIGDGKVVHAANPRSGVEVLPMRHMPFTTARRVVG